ncbi:hypothetical protein, partial [Mesorhizobium sp. M4B.F.Ca.ET.049.02.1.2]|uniref:hypothetical protein n=1 Tax=Mesorhizobium sp. M4B.F.Ca.ET.049.02.1.2 TaxID=2496752 RepID=UPI0016720465
MIPPPTMTTSTAPTAGCGWNADTVLGLCQIGSENGLGKEHLEMQWARENRIADFMDLKVRFDCASRPVAADSAPMAHQMIPSAGWTSGQNPGKELAA